MSDTPPIANLLLPLSRTWMIESTPDNPITGGIVMCMDYRNEEIVSEMQEASGRTLVTFRNPGAMIEVMIPELEVFLGQPQHDLQARGLIVRTHGGDENEPDACTAVKMALAILEGRIAASTELEFNLANHFKVEIERRQIQLVQPGKDPLDTLHKLNNDMKRDALGALADVHGIPLDIAEKPMDISNYDKSSFASRKVLMFTSPTNIFTHTEIAKMALGPASNETMAYLVQRASTLGTLQDLEVAYVAGITDVYLVSLAPQQDAYYQKVSLALKQEDEMLRRPFLREMNFIPVPFNREAAEQAVYESKVLRAVRLQTLRALGKPPVLNGTNIDSGNRIMPRQLTR